MHVRIAWEILSNQKKENPEKTDRLTVKTSEIHRLQSHAYPTAGYPRPPELSSFPTGLPGRPSYDGSLPPGLFTGPSSHIGKSFSKKEK